MKFSKEKEMTYIESENIRRNARENEHFQIENMNETL